MAARMGRGRRNRLPHSYPHAHAYPSHAGSVMEASPITYSLDGRQYVLTASGGVMFAWALPVGRATAAQAT